MFLHKTSCPIVRTITDVIFDVQIFGFSYNNFFCISDNALIVQSRFMLMEGMLLCFLCLAVLSLLKFRNLSHR